MRTTKREKLLNAQREALDKKRSAISKLRKEKRREKGKVEDTAKAIQRSPAGRKAAETLKTKRGIALKREQESYQEKLARAGARMGGRRKQLQGELRDEFEE